jgi:hypothetical protein
MTIECVIDAVRRIVGLVEGEHERRVAGQIAENAAGEIIVCVVNEAEMPWPLLPAINRRE